MTRPARLGVRRTDVVILSAALALAVVAVRWADRDFDRVEPASMPIGRSISRPEWARALERPSRRVQYVLPCLPAVATLAVAAILAGDALSRPRVRRRRAGPGAVVIGVALAVGGILAASQFSFGPPFRKGISSYFDLDEALRVQVPGAILGAWVALRLGARRRARPLGWRDGAARLVGWAWMVDIAWMIAHAVVFG